MTDSLIKALEDEVGKCISCGFCESVCPTLPAAGYNLWKGARGRVIMGSEVLKTLKSRDSRTIKVSDSFYSCLDCNACLQVCPAGVSAGLVSHLSREVITEGLIEENENPLARMIVRVTMKYMNPLAVREECADWFNGMEADPTSTDLLYTGNMFQLMAYTVGMKELRNRLGARAANLLSRVVSRVPSLIRTAPRRKNRDLSDRMNASLVSIATLLRKAGVSFNYLGRNEPYPGTFIYDLGYTEEFRTYAEKVSKILHDAGVKRIITVDPHTYDLLRNIYPKFVSNFDFEIVHYLDLIGNLEFKTSEERVTFHEPCHFTIRNDGCPAPLETLEKISPVELPARSGKRTRCCGGPNELLFPDLAEKVSDARYRELEELGTGRIVTACPICFTNLKKSDRVIDIEDYLAGRTVSVTK